MRKGKKALAETISEVREAWPQQVWINQDNNAI